MQNEEHSKSTIFYDTGCGSVMVIVFGVVFLGVVVDRFPNYSISSLYDAGGWLLIAIFCGAVLFGVMVDYFWNYLILSLTLRWQQISIIRKRKFIYIAIITGIGFLIDWLYYQFIWGTPVVTGSLEVTAMFGRQGFSPGLELSTILIPMALIGAVNYLASRFHLHLHTKHALVVGLAMAVFTAPWVLVAFLLLGR